MLRKITLGVLSLLVLGFVLSLFLPSTYEVERRLVIAAPPARIHGIVSDLHTWPDWTAWNEKRDRSLRFEYAGPERGKGARMSWKGEQLGEGNLEILESDAARGQRMKISFSGGAFTSLNEIEFREAGNGTEVLWRDRGELGFNPVARFIAYSGKVEDWIGRDLEIGLMRLKELAEGGPSRNSGKGNGAGGSKK